MSILDTILAEKYQEVAAAKRLCSIEKLRAQASVFSRRGFRASIRSVQGPAVIAEIKRASPSKGPIRPDLDPVATAAEFASAGAACLSVLTDRRFFDGRMEFLLQIREVLPVIPLLRKDFIVDEYQIWESKAQGADCILLIAAALPAEKLAALYSEALAAELEVLVEVHNSKEAESVLDSIDPLSELLLGINNRDLKTFEVDLAVSEQVMSSLPALLSRNRRARESLTVISESGIFHQTDLKRLSCCGIDGFLVGESLVAKGSPGENLKGLIQ